VSFFTIEKLLEYADELKLSPETLLSATINLDSQALRNLIDACSKHDDHPYLFDHFAYHITERAVELNNEQSFVAMQLLLEYGDSETAHPAAIWTLYDLKPVDKALSILRQALNDSYRGTYLTAAEVIFLLEYQSNTLEAIEDENSHVRLFALEEADRANNITTILKSLSHEDLALRRLAAWASGRKKIDRSLHLLLQQCQKETDLEALRAMIWALGVLRHLYAKPVIETFLQHQEPFIVRTAQEALGKLV
jgi:hypothetical protein